MGENEKTGLGRALVKHHNHMIQQSKEKGGFYRNQNKKVLQSVTEISDIDAVIVQAEEAERLFMFQNPDPNIPIDLDSSASGSADTTADEIRKQHKIEEDLHASSLKVPRR